MSQNITFKDIEKYPLLHNEAITYIKDRYLDLNYSDFSNNYISIVMRPWFYHKFGGKFWSLISHGKYNNVIIDFPELAYLLEENTKDKPLSIENNGLWK